MTTSPKSVETQDSLFVPKTFYTLHGAGCGVWIMCLVVGSINPHCSAFTFRIIALCLSLFLAIVMLIRAKKWKKLDYLVLTFFNGGLIFVNASGFNAITYNIPFEKLNFKKDQSFSHNSTGINYAGMFDWTNQKSWWPDSKMQYAYDSSLFALIEQKKRNEGLLNQFAFLKDWLQGAVRPEKKEEMNSILRGLGTYEPDSLDKALADVQHHIEVSSLNSRIESLKNEIKYKDLIINQTYEYDGKKMKADALIDSLTSNINRINADRSRLMQEMAYCQEATRKATQMIKDMNNDMQRRLDSLRSRTPN